MLSCARHGHWPLVRGAQGASPDFGNGHQNVFVYQTIRLIRTKFGRRHQGDEALLGFAPLLDPPLPKVLGGNRTPNPAFCSKIFLLKFTWPNARKLKRGLLEHV